MKSELIAEEFEPREMKIGLPEMSKNLTKRQNISRGEVDKRRNVENDAKIVFRLFDRDGRR